MKIVISRLELVSLINKIQNVVPSKPSTPIIGNVLLEAFQDQIVLSATDLALSIRAYTSAQVLEEGGMVIPTRHFFPLVKELTAPYIELHTITPEIALIHAGSSQFKIYGMRREEFPEFPQMPDAISFSMPSARLKEMLTKTSFAAANGDTRYFLNGILLRNEGLSTTLIGTNGKRLAKIVTQFQEPLASQGEYILPMKAVDEIIRLLDPKEEMVKISMTQDKICLETGAVTLIAKLMPGEYPDVSWIIPKQKHNPVQVHREELISLLRQVALFITEERSSVRFSFAPGELQLSVANGGLGEGKVHMPLNYQGKEVSVAFNPHFVLDALKHTKDETITFDFSDSYNPGVITDSSDALFVVMPMRLEG